jgi:hypothetical protein
LVDIIMQRTYQKQRKKQLNLTTKANFCKGRGTQYWRKVQCLKMEGCQASVQIRLFCNVESHPLCLFQKRDFAWIPCT